jgi:hypothetical protein
VNPKHLWIGTPLENTRDAIAKGKYLNYWKRTPNFKRAEMLTNY